MSLNLPKEIERYVASLLQVYKRKNQDLLQRLLVNAEIDIEQHSYDNWDGGQYGFLLRLRVPEIVFSEIIEDKSNYEKEIEEKINKLINIQGEFIDCVSIEMQLLEDDNWREKSGLILRSKKHISDNVLGRIWKPACVRAFLSHKAECKTEAGKLKDQLGNYGISCFVAHKDIKPTKEWVQEIENALFSMDVLIALMTDDFHESDWTDQEIGVAVGRHILIIPVKIDKDPYGFIWKYQALSGTWDNIPKMGSDILGIVFDHPSTKKRMERAAINAFQDSSSFYTSKYFVTDIFPRFEKMEEKDIEKIILAFNKNSQIYDSWSIQNKLPDLLCKWTGDQYHIVDNKLVKKPPDVSVDIPF
ncbi:MAG: toll/interleukin-1 receptor domain-containing protein [Sedimentisphaerales bacterium]|nr:toll/interleukin-1 receptor domain-containing protein [Sedimentisphaerales bacterium]